MDGTGDFVVCLHSVLQATLLAPCGKSTYSWIMNTTCRTLLASILICLLVANSLFAIDGTSSSYAGRVKTSTERFEIIYEPQDEWAARELVQFADEVYDELSGLLDHAPKRKIPVILTSRPADANGFFSPFPPKVTMHITSPANRFLGSRTAGWMRSLFTHELTHYIHLTSPVGPAKFLTPIFGPDVPAMNTLLMPGWWVEGITTYTESTYSAGGRGNSPTFAFTYRAPLYEDEMWSLSQGAYNSLNPPIGRIYTTGYLMVDHLYHTYGEAAFVEINKKYAAWPFFGMKPAFGKVTGKKPSEVFEDALAAVGQEIESMEAGPLFSPDTIGDFEIPKETAIGLVGQAHTPDEGDHLVRYGTDIEPLVHFAVNGRGNSTIAKDGSHAYITFFHTEPNTRESTPLAPVGFSDLYRYDFGSDTFHALTNGKKLTQPAVSNDGTRVVAIEAVQERYRLVVHDVATQKLRVLYEHPEGSIYQPSFSPDGNSVVAIEILDGKSTLLLVDMDGSARELWPHGDVEMHHPTFIDDHTIWFSADFDGILSLYETSPEGGSIHRILRDPIGIVGAEKVGDSVIYGTYTANGYALREVGSDRLEQVPMDIPTIEDTPHILVLPEESVASSRYFDLPRFNVWLPFTMDIPEFIPGATALFKSLLGTQVLQISGGYHIADALPILSVTYKYAPGPFSILFQGNVNEEVSADKRQQSVMGGLSIPIWRTSSPTGNKSLALSLATRANFPSDTSSVVVNALANFDSRGISAPKAYYGSTIASVSAGVGTRYRFDDHDTAMLAMFGLRGQVPLWNTHQVLRFDIDGGTSLTGGLIEGLNPIGFKRQNKYGTASALVTARYRIPFGIIDQPIPFGGLIGAGMTIYGQTLVHAIDGNFIWEEDVYLGVETTASMAIGAAFTLNATGTIALSIDHPVPTPLFSLSFTNLFGADYESITRISAR